MNALQSLRESVDSCEAILSVDPTIETVVQLTGQQARKVLDLIEKARGTVMTASATVGVEEVVPQWWGALVKALTALEESE